jgi:hypothetical protein
MNTSLYRNHTEADGPGVRDLRASVCEPGLAGEGSLSIVKAIEHLTSAQSSALLEHGGRLIAIQELCQSVVEQLSAQSREQVKRSFKRRIERVLELTDERAMPEASQRAMLSEVNYFLRVLDGSGSA